MNRAPLVASLVLLVGGAFLYLRRADAGSSSGASSWPALELPAILFSPVQQLADSVEAVGGYVADAIAPGAWQLPAAGEPYRARIEAAEDRHGIPRGMLARLLYQESRFRADIITGAVRSPAGALGIAQFMPATAAELGIDPLNPSQAIDGAGRYLRRLYDATGAWPLALAAYNWGIGNVQRRGIDAAPAETRNYISQILGDLGLA